MDRRSFLLEMRKAGQLKGTMPCFVTIKASDDCICKKSGQFVMSYRDGVLYFQKIVRLFNMLRPEDDFKVDCSNFVCYKKSDKRATKVLTLLQKDGIRLPIEYLYGTKETFATEDNLRRIILELNKLGLVDMESVKNAQE